MFLIISNSVQFGKVRSFLFPIYNHEFKKFFAFAGIMFCMIMNYTLLRNMKDVLVVNAAGAGIITFLKTYCVTPVAIVYSNRVKIDLLDKLVVETKKNNYKYSIATILSWLLW